MKAKQLHKVLALFIVLFPMILQAQWDHDAVAPMPADSLSPAQLKKAVADSGGLHIEGGSKAFNFMLLPYPMLMGGMEQISSKGSKLAPFHEVGGGAGFRLGYDSLLLLSVDGFVLSQTSPAYWEEALGAPDISPGYGVRNGKRVQRFSGQIQMRPSTHFTLRLGRGQHFFGNGHRSLLLSHNSDANPYLRLDSEFGRFHYVNLYSKLQHLRGPASDRDRERESKYGAFHYLSFEASDRWSFGFFESVIWQGKDSTNPRGFDADYLNPVIFYRPVEYAQGSSDRVLMGLDIEYRAFSSLKLYFQGMLDEFLLDEMLAGRGWWGNKYGVQGGFHWEEAFGSPHLSWRMEFNTVRPYSYSHGSAVQSYSHRGRPLAHPLGANFMEGLSILQWRNGPWGVRAEGLYARYGNDPSRRRSFGRDPLKPYQWRVRDYGNRTGQGKGRELLFAELQGSYLLDEQSGLRGGLAVAGREVRMERGKKERWLMGRVFLRSSLFPRYRDF